MTTLNTESLKASAGYHYGYHVTHEAWYSSTSPNRTPSITVGLNADEGGCAWEFVIDQGEGTALSRTCQIGMPGDSWRAFTEVPELFTALAAVVRGDDAVTLDEVREVLDKLGFRDETARVSPYADTYPACEVCGKRAVDGSNPPLCPPHRAEVDGWLRERRRKG